MSGRPRGQSGKASPRTNEKTAAILAGVAPGARTTRGNSRSFRHNQVRLEFHANPAPARAPTPRRARLCSRRLPLAKGSDSRLACSKRTQWELGGGPDGLGTGLETVALGTTAQGVPVEVSARVLLPAVTSSSTKPT